MNNETPAISRDKVGDEPLRPDRCPDNSRFLSNRQKARNRQRLLSLAPPMRFLIDSGVPLYWDVGCGHGEFLVYMARHNRKAIFFATEIKRRRAEETRFKISRAGLNNAFVFRYDSATLAEDLPVSCLAGIFINHPDPWPKDRHHKNRLIAPDTATAFANCLIGGGNLVYVSDHQEAAMDALVVLDAEEKLVNINGPGKYTCNLPPEALPGIDERLRTRYENKAHRQGIKVFYMLYRARK